jgi:hypothetical protein
MQKNPGTQKALLWGGIAFGLISLVVYSYSGLLYSLIIAPIIFLMIWSRKVEYFPGIAIHLFAETTSMYIILLSCLVLTLFQWRFWMRTKIKWLFLLVLIPIPILIWHTYVRYFMMDIKLVDSITKLGFFLGIFPFFYGFLLAKKIDREILFGIIFVLLLSIFLNSIGYRGILIRIIFFAVPALITFAIIGKFSQLISGFQILLKVSAILIFVSYFIFLNTTTLTVFLSVLLSVLLAYIKKKNFDKWVNILSPRITFIVTILLVGWLAITTDSTRFSGNVDPNKDLTTLRFTNFNDIADRLSYKTFGDRAPIWRGVWLDIVAQNNILPPLKSKSYEVTGLSGGHSESDIAAHNIFLELLRNYGYIVGLIIGFAYIVQIVLAGSLLRLPINDTLLISIVSSVAIVGTFGGMTGQFTMMPSFSFLFMGLAGILYGLFYTQNMHYNKKNG